ncbi:MAG TPA: Holliday junction branch migration protein RuvA [Candidatus Limiplasma sp.]|nr:Holliday junction branch migration protein RuvA [Candidatus Limiplasma sp.]
MIALIEGTVYEKSANDIVLLSNGIGFRLFCSMNTIAAVPAAGQPCSLYTHLIVRDDAMELYGFLARDERDLFLSLISVSGVGPKSAVGILGSLPLADLRLAILTGDVALLSRAQGIGKKTAQRISLELKDKLAKEALSMDTDSEIYTVAQMDTAAQDTISEAILALKSLGYSPVEAADAIKNVKGQADTTDELIKLALRYMAQKQ